MDIEKFLKFGETESTEFKESFNKKTVETAAAFSNTRGGTIFIGVNDDGGLKGISIGKETLKDWSNKISQNTEPSVIPEIRIENVNEKSIVIIKIQEYPLKPVATRGRCFRRVANSNRQMSPQEIAQMHLMSTGNSWDALPARDVAFDDIDLENVKNYIKASFATGRRKFRSTEDPLEILEKLELLKNGKPTWAAILLFGKRPQSPLTQAQVHCGRFKNNVKIIDDRLFAGTIIDQVEEVMSFIRKHINVEFVISGRPRRDEIWDYPLDALREALINMVDKKVLEKFRTTGRGTYYFLEKAQKAQ